MGNALSSGAARSLRAAPLARRTTRALLLDVGGPLLRLPFELLDRAERSYGLPPGTIRWRGPFDPKSDSLWPDRQAGRLSDGAYWTRRAEEVERAAGRAGGMREFVDTCFQGSGLEAVRTETAALVAEARAAGLKVGALSNDAARLLPPEFLDGLSILWELDAFVDLSYGEVAKPDAKAYAIAVEALGLEPPQVLFVDDHPRNVAGAEAAGLPALYFDVTDVAATIGRIRQRLGLPG